MKFSAVIVAKNEEDMIRGCIESLVCADEVILVDDYSTDNTSKIAKKMGAKIYKRRLRGFATQKNYGISKAKNKWVLILDADEIVTKELSDEIANIKNNNFIGYDMPFKNYVGKKWLKYGGLYPDRHIRLFDKTKCTYGPREIHEELVYRGTIGHLNNDIIHYTYKNFEEYASKVRKYSKLEAASSKEIPSPFYPLRIFIDTLILKRGIYDGLAGIRSAFLLAYYQKLKRGFMK